MKLVQQIGRTLKAIKFSARACKILFHDHAYFASIKNGELRDRNKNYLPWFTYPAIEALSNWDLSDKRVFEYGSGFSTLFWASRAKEVVSVEHSNGLIILDNSDWLPATALFLRRAGLIKWISADRCLATIVVKRHPSFSPANSTSSRQVRDNLDYPSAVGQTNRETALEEKLLAEEGNQV